MRVLTIGTFDLWHAGHDNIVAECFKIGKDVTVGVNSDLFVQRYKGITPHDSQHDRIQHAADVEGRPYVDLHRGHTKSFILSHRAECLVIGSDWGRKDYLAQLGVDWDWMDRHGVRLMYVPYTKGVSSTQLRADVGLLFPTDPAGIAEGPAPLCGATLNEAMCERPRGHDDPHRAGPLEWVA